MKMFEAISVLFLLSACAVAAGTVKTEVVKYTVDGIVMHGFLAYPEDIAAPRPGILVVHEWMGLNAYAKRRAEELAALGYVALAADMYGEGKTAKDTTEASAWAGALKAGDRSAMRLRAATALQTLREWKFTDRTKLAAIGYCFGGTTVLELARSGADLRGVVSFHGGLDTPKPDETRGVHPAILVCHGADDPYNPKALVDAFQDEMRKSGADWQMVFYGDAVHSFSNPEAGNDKSKGAAYDAKADRRSRALMRSFLDELFGEVRK